MRGLERGHGMGLPGAWVQLFHVASKLEAETEMRKLSYYSHPDSYGYCSAA